jgi:hypothetical protein
MRFPSADRYNEAVQNPAVFFVDSELKRRRVQTDALGLPEVLSGGFAYTYRLTGVTGDLAVRCFHREIPELFERYRAISTFLHSLGSRFFVDFAFVERGILMDGAHLPVVSMRWVEGETLLGFVSRQRSQQGALERLRQQLLAFAEEAEAKGYAHGDIQHRNLLVAPNGDLKLVDYDGMYVPALRHLRAADSGHPHFQPPSRNEREFGPHMDRFPLAVIDFSLEILSKAPALFDQFHLGENLILSRDDFLNPAASPALNAIARLPGLAPRVAVFSDLCGLAASEMPSLREFRAGPPPRPSVAYRQSPTGQADRVSYTSPFDVVDGMDYRHAKKFVGRPVEMIGCVLSVMNLHDKDIVILRFGESYSGVPSVVVPHAVFSAWSSAQKMSNRPWISVTGVLQYHRSGRYQTVQVLVKENSDVEFLSDEDEAKYRLGRTTRPAPVVPPRPTDPATAPTWPPPDAKPVPVGSGLASWKIARDGSGGAPTWSDHVGSRAARSSSAPAPRSSPTSGTRGSRAGCPVCTRESFMPAGVVCLQCVHCGKANEIVRWRHLGLVQTSATPNPTAPPAPSSPAKAPSAKASASQASASQQTENLFGATPQTGNTPQQQNVLSNTGSFLSRLARFLLGGRRS